MLEWVSQVEVQSFNTMAFLAAAPLYARGTGSEKLNTAERHLTLAR